MEHTPGPWGWTYDGSKDYSIGTAEDPQAMPVAHIYAWQRNYDKAAANCALIAASPELLAALKWRVEGEHDNATHWPKGSERDGHKGDFKACPHADCALIRKAEGEEQIPTG